VDYAQLEAAPFASSPIETVAAAVTRNATSLSRNWTLPANNFSGQIKFRPQFAQQALPASALFLQFTNSPTDHLTIYINTSGAVQGRKNVNGAGEVFSGVVSPGYSSGSQLNIRFKQSTFGVTIWVNSAAPINATSGIWPSGFSNLLVNIILGGTAGFISVESLKLWESALSDDYLASLT
jgi:hypothetical protein